MSLADKLRGGAKPEDYAPPKVREAQQLASLEKEIASAAPVGTAPVRNLGTSDSMSKVTNLLKNSVTKAHDETCAAVDRVLADAGKMMDRLTMAVHDHNTMLRENGQRIAHELEAALQALTHAVTWVENHTPKLLDPKVDQNEPEVTDSKLLLQDQKKAEEPKEPKEPKNGKRKEPEAKPE